MKKVAATAKKTAAQVATVPQHIGRTILSVPQTIAKISKKQKESDDKPEFADKLEFISKEILEDQHGRRIVRESQAECMNEIIDHLESYLIEHKVSTYEEWIAAVHPDNAEYEDGRIDHRFYAEDSDHRLLWNQVMVKRGFEERVIETKSIMPNYNRI